MNQIQIFSPAKLNWLLLIGATRPDGFHSLGTVFQALDYGDTLLLERRDDNRCELTGFPADIKPDTNLVLRGWQLMREHYPEHVSGVDVTVDKVLPRGGGLGGGSSNAAAMMAGLARLFNIPVATETLEALGGSLGSDVSFFFRGGTAAGTGRGEILAPVKSSARYWLVLITPPEGISTAEAYRKLDGANRTVPSDEQLRDETQKFAAVVNAGDPVLLAAAIQNDFELVTTHLPWFQQACNKLQDAGALRAFLCGSGSTVAGLCADQATAEQVASRCGGTAVQTLLS